MEPLDLEHLRLAEILDFQPELGVIRLHEQRVVILSTVALGLLRNELIDTLGWETTRRVMLRFGYADGYHDAVSLRDRSNWTSPLDGLRAGVVLHRLEGIVQAEITRVGTDEASGKFDAEVIWRSSYVAEQHVHHSGKSDDPVCWSLVGYASGYASACFGREIYYDEVSCVAQGHSHCSVVGKDATSWGDQLPRLRIDFQSGDLGPEVDRLRALVHERIKDLDRREQVVAKRERELNLLRDRVAQLAAKKQFVAGSASMQQVLEFAARVAPLDTTVLVQGESGTGKEFIVRLIHDQSSRASGPFVSVNCAALTETLLESELFGHVRGAFTGAVRDKPGLFEVANGGTLFLDEIGEVAPTVQAKLLRALQEREIRRVGGDRNFKVNARVVAATNRDLRAAVEAGTFREDLFFRLSAFVIEVPPLRERRDDIPVLVHNFVRRASTRMKKDVDAVSAGAMNALMSYRWPGNVRELEHAIERAVILAQGTTIQVRELPPEVTRKTARSISDDTLNLADQEVVTIERALKRFHGNRRQAANALKISPVTLWRKMKRYGLEG